jgi:3-methyl-2-oxobutanoate hydroxymethyltransferase
MARISAQDLLQKKQRREPISMLTCYDAVYAKLIDEAEIDIVFVGDSVGTNCLGYSSEREVTLSDMCHHQKAVARGSEKAYRLVDMPWHSYDTESDAVKNAISLIQAGADAVKLEGYRPEIIAAISKAGIHVWAHLGLTPQWITERRLQAKTAGEGYRIFREAKELESAGASAIVLELIPSEVAAAVADALRIPIIGIGSGPDTDGQVQVINDVLGLTEKRYWHAFQDFGGRVQCLQSFRAYADAVRSGKFPGSESTRHYAPEELASFNILKQSEQSRQT